MPRPSPAIKKLKAKKLAKHLTKLDGNVSAVARERGISKQAVSEQVNTPEVQDAIIEELAKAGADKVKFCRVVSESMDANEVEIIMKGRGKKRETIKFESPDHMVRLKGADLFAKVTRLIREPGASGKGPTYIGGIYVNLPGGLDSIL